MSESVVRSGSGYVCERATSNHLPGLLELFEQAGSGCYCQYWHFTGDKNAWLERCYVTPEKNREALAAQLASPELYGVVAMSAGAAANPGTAIAGWLKVTRAANVARIYEQRVYRSLPCFGEISRDHVYAIGCLYVAETERSRGAASALLSGAITAATEAGASAIEAFPRKAPDGARLRGDEVWMGPEALYERAGFRAVSDFRPYPVLRLQLR
jgi:GNAT superfamily N-acetyltransferase